MPFKLKYFSDSGGIPTLNPKWAFGLKPNVYSNSTTEPYKQKTTLISIADVRVEKYIL